jgi:hypothetical protein
MEAAGFKEFIHLTAAFAAFPPLRPHTSERRGQQTRKACFSEKKQARLNGNATYGY